MIDHWLNRTLEVWRRADTDDGMGGKTTGEPTLIATEKFKVDQPSAVEERIAEQEQSTHTHDVFANAATAARRGDELREPAGGSGQVFRVFHTLQPSRPIYTKALCELIQREP